MFLSRRCRALLDGVAVGADPVSRLSPFALARLALRAARENRASVSLWRALAARTIALAPSMQPTDMSIVAFSFARLRYRDREMMLRLAEATPAVLGQFRATDITYFLAAFARLDVHHKVVFNLFAREIARKLHDFNAAQLGELVYAYARLGLKHELLLDVLKKRVAEVVKALRPWHLAMVANGFARLGVADERFFTMLAAEICRRISDFTGRPLALVGNAYARLGVQNRFLLEVLGDEAFRRRGELEPQAVALILNAHARLQISNPVVFDYFAQDVPRRIKSYNLHSLCLVASAFARAGRAEKVLFEKIGHFACNQAVNLYPRAVAALLFAFSEVDIRHGVLFFNAPSHVAEHVASYSVDELAMIARAYGRFQMVHLPLFDAITAALPGRQLVGAPGTHPQLEESEFGTFTALGDPSGDDRAAPPPRVSSLVWLLEAYARLTIFDASSLQLLCDALVAREGDLEQEPELVVQAVRAAAALSWAHMGLVRVGAACLAARGDDLPLEELEQLARALRELGAGPPEDDGGGRLLLERFAAVGAHTPPASPVAPSQALRGRAEAGPAAAGGTSAAPYLGLGASAVGVVAAARSAVSARPRGSRSLGKGAALLREPRVAARAFEEELGVQAPLGYWDPLGFSKDGDYEEFYRRREAELKNGRVAMYATIGYMVPEYWRLPGYLSPSGDLTFEQVPNGLQALGKVPLEGWLQILAYCGWLEVVVNVPQNPEEPGNYYKGRLGVIPKTRINDEDMRKRSLNAELANGRLAMMAIIGMFFQDGLTGSAWGDWSLYTASPLRACETNQA